MTQRVQHPVYGEILYTENFWSGKKSLVVNGKTAQPLSKKEFLIDEKRAVLNGSLLFGATLQIENEVIELSPKAKWYELFLAILPLSFMMVWGNNLNLCLIFPVVGGALGGAIGGLGLLTALFLMKKTNEPGKKILFGLGALAMTIALGYLAAQIVISFMLA